MSRTFIIAEAGVNHNGLVELAKQLVDVAAEAGADAVKFQSFITENEISKNAQKAEYQLKNTDDQESQFEMVKKLELNEKQFAEIYEHCIAKNIQFLSSPFDLESLKMLIQKFELKTIKIPSGEITNPFLLLETAMADCNVILSTGMCYLGEIETALAILSYGYLKKQYPHCLEECFKVYRSHDAQQILKEKVTLLHCNTEYPTPYSDVNLAAMDTLRQSFKLNIGLSDHTEGIAIPIAAVAKGAKVIEKHITTDKTLPGPDHSASLNPDELKEMVRAIRQVEEAIGHGMKTPTLSELKNINIVRKSIIAATEIKKGERFTLTNLTFKRPGTGISPLSIFEIVGKTALRDYKEDEIIDIYE